MCEPSCLVAWVTRLVRAERPRLVAIARREGLPDADALDAVQEAVLTFLGRDQASALASASSSTMSTSSEPAVTVAAR